jgi:hypothetical protein
MPLLSEMDDAEPADEAPATGATPTAGTGEAPDPDIASVPNPTAIGAPGQDPAIPARATGSDPTRVDDDLGGSATGPAAEAERGTDDDRRRHVALRRRRRRRR